MGQRFDILPTHGAAQDKLQQLVIGQGVRTAIQEPLSQTFPVTGNIGGLYWWSRPGKRRIKRE